GRPLPRRLDRHQRGRGRAPGQRARPRQDDRHDPRRLRQPLSKQAVQPRLPALQEPPGADMARPLTGTPGYARPEALVQTSWLAERLDAPDIRVVDGSWYLPALKRDPKAEFLAEHIPGAVYFDIDDIADTDSPLPHMLPSPEKFASRVKKLGLGDGN